MNSNVETVPPHRPGLDVLFIPRGGHATRPQGKYKTRSKKHVNGDCHMKIIQTMDELNGVVVVGERRPGATETL